MTPEKWESRTIGGNMSDSDICECGDPRRLHYGGNSGTTCRNPCGNGSKCKCSQFKLRVDLRDEIATLRAEVERLTKDRERLDAIFARQQIHIVPSRGHDKRWWVDIQHYVGAYWVRLADAFGETPREALDKAIERAAAIEAAKGGEE